MKTFDEMRDELDRLAASPRGAGFGPAIHELRVRLKRVKSTHGTAWGALVADVRLLAKAMATTAPSSSVWTAAPMDPLNSMEAVAERARRRAELREQLDRTVHVADINYLASRAGERRRRGQTHGQTQHVLDGARAKGGAR